jgi:hypothetical protein
MPKACLRHSAGMTLYLAREWTVARWLLRPDGFAANVAAMVWGVQRKYRRVAAALALLGVAFYALLLPGHLTSQFNAQLYKADIGMFADAICLSGEHGSKPMPATSCPICKGIAAFQLAMTPPEQASLPVMPHATPVLASMQDDVAGVCLPTPRSRGPPLLA